jgi:hypothetical protein
MTITSARYANWKAPAEDGQTLLWPEPGDLLRETVENSKSLAAADSVLVQGVPVSRLRRDIRRWLGHVNDAQPLVATGHQTELYHPGVWVKDAAINAIADRCGGVAVHFAVDTDQPKHLNLRWPGTTLPITDDPALTSAEWSGLLASPTPSHLYDLEQAYEAAAAKWNFQPMLQPVLDSLRRSCLDSIGLSAAITNAQHELDWSLGLKHRVMLVSPMLSSSTYLVFVHHVLSRAVEFASQYNTALAEYRIEAGITSQTRPMPDLHVTETSVEVPFWFDDLANGSRKRAEVRKSADAWVLASDESTTSSDFILDPLADGEKAADQLGAWLRRHQLRLSPRALTLTTFLRLLVVDQFIHGIGGGRYDQVTDRLLTSHFKIDPPRFAVATGTLFFPGAVGQPRVCMPCLLQEGHRLKHTLLGASKRDIIDRINALPRKSVQRSLAFHNMHAALSAAAVDHPSLKEFSARFESSVLRQRDEQVLFDRELFYAMQSQPRLAGMIDKLRSDFGDSTQAVPA